MDAFVSVFGMMWALVLVLFGWSSTVAMATRREDIIKSLLNDSVYDNRIPPNYEDNFPTNVTIQLFVLSFDSVTESSMDYSMTIFLREHWVDERLKWEQKVICADDNNGNNSNATGRSCNKQPTTDNYVGYPSNSSDNFGDDLMGDEVLDRLEVDSKLLDMFWMPDLYFVNDKDAKIHDVTMANRLLHIYRNGTIRTSIRISLTLSCDMYLERYPHDEQTCSIYLGSYSFSIENVIFKWHDLPVVIRDGVTLPRFRVQIGESGECNFKFDSGSMIGGNYTCIRADFELVREFGYYIAQVYVPSCLIVMLSWVSFWIDLEAIPARVSLGLLTVLTMTTQSTGEKASLPRVSYLKAIDVWMSGCLVFVFAALLEFAYVNVQSRVEKRRQSFVERGRPGGGSSRVRNGASITSCDPIDKITEESEVEVTMSKQHVSKRHLFKKDFTGVQRARMADKFARVCFPFSFLIFNIIYWMVYVASPIV
ncbi:glycine receptor subunit alpha-2-like isoform X2 [Littorina saxatilis]|uniref:glycine receptor subunit alpha-2-like isoform X2 n=1 Tax=Littorina saxatilis TaxID=31220 RepID=UPI0038B61E5B